MKKLLVTLTLLVTCHETSITTAFADGISGSTTAANFQCTGACLTGDGTAANPGYAFINEINTGFWRSAAGVMRFSALGTDQFAFDSTGALYPLTTNTGSIGKTANVFANVYTQNMNVASALLLPNGTATTPALAFTSQPGLGLYRQTASVLSFTGTAGNSPLLDFDAFNNVFYPDSAGGTPTNLGKTTAPFNNVFAQGQFNLQPNNTAVGSGFQFIPEPANTLPLIQSVNCTPTCTTSWNMGFSVGNTFTTSFGNGTISAADLNFTRGAASSVNGITVNYGVPTGNNPSIVATGSDLNVGLTLTPKGTGTINVGGSTSLSPANANVTISPTGTGTVTVNPATTGSMDNVAIGNNGSTRATGSFTNLLIGSASNASNFIGLNRSITGAIQNVAIGAFDFYNDGTNLNLERYTGAATFDGVFLIGSGGAVTVKNAASTTLFSIAGTTGNTNVSGTLAVTGATTLNGAVLTTVPNTQTGATYTVAATDFQIVLNNAAGVTVTLPAASGSSGRILLFRTIAAGAVVSAASNVVPLAGGVAGTAILTATAGKFAWLQSDGTNWQISMAN